MQSKRSVDALNTDCRTGDQNDESRGIVAPVGHGNERRNRGFLVKSIGDRVEEDEPLAEIEAEKATQELESPASGILSEILVQEGEDAHVRTILAYIETGE